MDRSLIAGYCLTASAFFLAGLLLLTSGLGGQAAQAEMHTTRGDLTAMTAQTRNGVESLFLLDNNSARMLIYNVDRRDGFELVGNIDLAAVFARAAQNEAGTP